MKKLTILCATILLTGCGITKYATLDKQSGYNPYSANNKLTIGLANIKDSRKDDMIGHIGLADMAVSSDLSAYTESALKQKLVQSGFNTVASPNPEDAGSLAAIKLSNNNVLAASIYSVSMNSFDALMDPVDVSINLSATVYSKDGKKTYSANYEGKNSEILGIPSTHGKDEGKLLANAVNDAVNKIVGDANLRKALEQK